MPLPAQAIQKKPGIDWPGIIGVLVVQLAVLLALSCAVIFYLNWSSDAAQAAFMTAIKSPASAPNHSQSTPIQQVKAKTTCNRKV
jgi:hypothetical protein